MSRRFRLATVLRARKAQETAAKAAARAARTAEQAAADRRDEREAALLRRPTIDGGPAAWYVAALSSRQAMAAEVSAAARLAAEAAAALSNRTGELTGAANARRMVETLADRHAAALAAADVAADQRAVDEIVSARRPDREQAP